MKIVNWKLKIHNKYFITGFILCVMLIGIFTPLAVSAQQNQQGFQLVPCGSTGQDPCTFTHIVLLIYRIINFLLATSGVVAVLMILYYAFQMVSSLGEPERLAGAKQGMTRAIIGFAIILLSFVIIGTFLSIFGITCQPWDINAWTPGSSAGCLPSS